MSSSSKRTRKSWKYYFATSSLRHILSGGFGRIFDHEHEYCGILAENLIASTLKTISKKYDFDIYFDSNKIGVDFLIQTDTFDTIPIELGYGKKSKKQVKTAINKYNADYGIIVSNTTDEIEKDDNVIYVPLETFSYI